MTIAPQPATPADAPDVALPHEAIEILGRVLSDRRVLLMGGSVPLRAAIEAVAREVSLSNLPHDSYSGMSAVRDAPVDAVVVGEDLGSTRDPGSSLASIARMAAGAPILLAFRNRASAAALVGTLLGDGEPEGLTPGRVEGWLKAAGLYVQFRAGVRAPLPRIAPDAALRVRTMLEALAPDAEMRWVLWAAAPGGATRVSGLLSVVVRTHDPARLALLDQAVFSLACQQWRPLEIVLAIQPRSAEHIAAAEALLVRHQPIGGYTYRLAELHEQGDRRGRLVNIGIRAARGQYLAFLDDDDVVYPGHYARLIDAIRTGPHGWAASRVRLARFSRTREDELYCTEKTLFPGPEEFDLLRLIRSNYIPNHAYVLDRDRLGALPISFSETVARAEDYELLLRLAGTFRPAWVRAPGCEYRLRDDGTNVNPMADGPEHARAGEALQWRSSDEARESMKARWPVVFTVSELEQEAESWELAPLLSPDRPLRHYIADAANEAIKRLVPGWHPRLKRWVRRAILRSR